jgi:hypothetical protein
MGAAIRHDKHTRSFIYVRGGTMGAAGERMRSEKDKCSLISRVQMKSWAGKVLETVNCCAFLKRRLIGAC